MKNETISEKCRDSKEYGGNRNENWPLVSEPGKITEILGFWKNGAIRVAWRTKGCPDY